MKWSVTLTDRLGPEMLNLVWPCLKVMVLVFNPEFIDKNQ